MSDNHIVIMVSKKTGVTEINSIDDINVTKFGNSSGDFIGGSLLKLENVARVPIHVWFSLSHDSCHNDSRSLIDGWEEFANGDDEIIVDFPSTIQSENLRVKTYPHKRRITVHISLIPRIKCGSDGGGLVKSKEIEVTP